MNALQIFTSILISIFLGFTAGWIFFRKKFNETNGNINCKIREITDTFKEKLNNNERKFNELKAKISEVGQKTIQDWDLIKKEAEKLRNADKTKTAMLNDMEAEAKSRQSAIKNLLAEISSLKTTLEKKETGGESGAATLAEVENEKLAELESRLSEEQKAKNEIENRLKEQSTKAAELNGQLTELKSKATEEQSKINKHETKAADMEKQLVELTAGREELENRLKKQQAEKTDLESRLSDKRKELSEIENRLEKQQSDMAEFEARMEDRKRKQTELESRAELHDNEKAELKEQIAKQQMEQEELLERLAEAVQKKSDLEENSTRHEAEISELKAAVAGVETRIEKERESFLDGVTFVKGNHFLPGSVIKKLIEKSAANNN